MINIPNSLPTLIFAIACEDYPDTNELLICEELEESIND